MNLKLLEMLLMVLKNHYQMQKFM
ncbi:UNVERIFIED_CONTAM: hypothetical protein GTU68_061216 [Idotea baltica]|nr:hypothetical protein [Idotea baltica]